MTSERYEDFLGNLPHFAPDPRQERFIAASGGIGGHKRILIDKRMGKVEIANVGRGWYASQPNLAFLQTGMFTLISAGKLDPMSRQDVFQFINWATQCVVRVTTTTAPGEAIGVHFWTKDDLGVYEYGFSVPLRQ